MSPELELPPTFFDRQDETDDAHFYSMPRFVVHIDAETIAAMRFMWERLKIVVEPSSAVPLAAIFRHRDRFAGKRVGLIVTGGNVDLDHLPWIN